MTADYCTHARQQIHGLRVDRWCNDSCFPAALFCVLSLSSACPVAVGSSTRVLYDAFLFTIATGQHTWPPILALTHAVSVIAKKTPLTFSLETIDLISSGSKLWLPGQVSIEVAAVPSCPSCDAANYPGVRIITFKEIDQGSVGSYGAGDGGP